MGHDAASTTIVIDPAERFEPSGFTAARAAFLAAHPTYAASAERFEALRAAEYGRLDTTGHVYLDYTGAGLYAASQLERHHELLRDAVLGNPHSHNPSSLASTALVERARDAVLDFLHASPDEYDVVFTANATGALKLVGESYPFGPGSCYLISYDDHNSVNGIREFARRAGATVAYAPVREPDLRLDAAFIERALTELGTGSAKLFAYPAQSNFSGVQHPLTWVARARDLGWDVLLDCAAFAPTNHLDLSVVHPDFVPLSFYKLFGYPTGVGALVVRHEALAKLRRPWFAGGTITLASVQGDGWHHLAPGHTGFEDGTVDFLGLPAVTIGLGHLSRVGVDAIHEHAMALTGWLLAAFGALRHGNGAPLVRVFGPRGTDRRGATVAFYLLDPAGEVFDVYRVEKLAAAERISIRTGCFCNPGDGEVAHHITRSEMAGCFAKPAAEVTLADCQRLIAESGGKAPNTIRASLGIASDFADVYRFMGFVAGFRDRAAAQVGR